MKNIVLTGFMGTGKTEVGRILAEQLGLGFVDTDEEIERATGKSIPEIFHRFGVVRFRSEENLVIKKISDREGLVIATGGGAVLNPENVAALKKKGIIVLLRSSPEVIYDRVKADRNRPLLAVNGNLAQHIRDLMHEREGIYRASADLEINSENKSKDQVAALIVKLLKERRHI